MRNNIPALVATGIIVVLAVALIGTLIFVYNQPAPTRGVTPLVEIAERESDSSVWGLNFPNQYSTFLKTAENNTRTAFGGSVQYSKLEDNPRLLILFQGYGFSKDYNDERGHMYSLQDVREIGRITEASPGTCYSCKSSDNPRLWNEMTPAGFFATPFSELGHSINEPIGCANCHEANSMRLVVTNPALEAALQVQGKDWTTFTRQEMRTVVCGNCHVEYYFKGEGSYLTFPWQNGTRIEDIASYYQEIEFTDWTHPQTGTPMIKMQHPEYELFTADSTHYRAGVSCADCHMPYTRDGAAKFSNHNVQSPLVNPEAACGACHTSTAYVVERVGIIQNQVWETMSATEEALLDAIEALAAATAAQGANQALIDEARTLHREAQLRWDFISAENSMGFHNPSETLRILANATDLARQAQIKAIQAVQGGGMTGFKP
jgi:nitrite reductase (cytochrome c-552)